MTHPHLNAAHRLAVIRRLQSVTPKAPTNSRTPERSDTRTIPELAASITARIEELRSVLAEAKRSTAPPVATARQVETAARRAAADLSAVRRAAAPTSRAITTQQSPATMPSGLSASARRAWARAQSVMSAENAKTFSTGHLQTAACHPASPPAEAAIARAELQSRGMVFHANGSISHRQS